MPDMDLLPVWQLEEQGPIAGTLPIGLVSALREQQWHLPLWASKWCLWAGPQAACIHPIQDTLTPQASTAGSCVPPLHRHASLELLRRPLEWDAVFDGTLGTSSVITYMVIMWAHSALSLALHPTTQCSVCTASAHGFYLPVLLP